MPDSGIMLELCELLKINVNELLSGERIMAEAYDKRAEENLLAMRREVEEKNRQMLQTEYWIAIPAVIAGLIMVFVASFLEMPVWLRIALIVFALIMIFTVAFIAVGIEQKAGYYECQNCHHRYVPTYWQTNLAMHMGRTIHGNQHSHNTCPCYHQGSVCYICSLYFDDHKMIIAT